MVGWSNIKCPWHQIAINGEAEACITVINRPNGKPNTKHMIRLSDIKTAKNLKVGDTVTSDYHEGDEHVPRTITKIEHNTNTGTTVRVWADDGGLCKCCNRPLSKKIQGVCGAWLIPA